MHLSQCRGSDSRFDTVAVRQKKTVAEVMNILLNIQMDIYRNIHEYSYEHLIEYSYQYLNEYLYRHLYEHHMNVL